MSLDLNQITEIILLNEIEDLSSFERRLRC